MLRRTKLVFAVAGFAAVAIAISCGNFAGTDSGSSPDSDSGNAADGSVGADAGNVIGTQMDGGTTNDSGTTMDANDAAEVEPPTTCLNHVCTEAGILDAACPANPALTTVTQYYNPGTCVGNACLMQCDLGSPTAGFSAVSLTFHVYANPAPGLIPIFTCKASSGDTDYQIFTDSCPTSGKTIMVAALGYTVPSASCGSIHAVEFEFGGSYLYDLTYDSDGGVPGGGATFDNHNFQVLP